MKKQTYRELLIGCGSQRDKRIHINDRAGAIWKDLTTLDNNATHRPDVVHDLNKNKLPFKANTFDEIHAYEVLEHLGTQGDYKGFFSFFSDVWRVLKPYGCLCFTCPKADSVWAWGDPSHTRVVTPEQLIFLSQKEYEQVGVTPMSDFRYLYKADLQTVAVGDYGQHCWYAVLQAKKGKP